MKCESCTKYDDCRTGSGLTWPCGAYRPKTGSGMDIEKMIEQLEAWNEQHLSMVCGGGYFACDYLCENEDCIVVRAATALSTLQAENEKLRETVDKYATAARAIALNLKPFCDESLPYDEMIADAARKASDEMERVKREMDATVEGLRVCSIENNMECQYCLYRTARSFCWNCADGSNWKFRGQKED